MEKRKEEQNFFPLRIKLIPIMLILLIIIFNMGAFTSLNESDARDLYDQTRGFLEKLLKEKNKAEEKFVEYIFKQLKQETST